MINWFIIDFAVDYILDYDYVFDEKNIFKIIVGNSEKEKRFLVWPW